MNFPESNTITHKVQINFHVLGALMLNRVGGEVYSTNVVAVNHRSLRQRAMKFSKKLAEPTCFGHSISNAAIFSFSARTRDCLLPFGRPGHQIIANKGTEAGGRAPSIGAARPVRIGVNEQIMRGAVSDLKTILDSALDVAKNALQKREVFLPRIMHMQADLLDGVRDVRPCKSKVLKTTS